MKFRVLIEHDEDGVFVATAPVLPGCVSDGATREEALSNVREAITLYLESLEARRRVITDQPFTRTSVMLFRFTLRALLLFPLALLLALPARAQDTTTSSDRPMRRTISVSGEGLVRVEPDQATARFGVVTQAQNPDSARLQNAEAAARAMNAIRELGLADRKLRLETLRLQPAHEYNPETRRYEEKGYEAIREVVVEVDSLDLLPTIIAEVVQQGANRLQGVEYGLQDRRATRDAALQEAVRDAREKAALMAGTLGLQLGQVVQISEQSFSFPRPMMRMEMDAQMATSKAEATPVPEAYAAGEMEVNANVQVVFLLEER